MLRKLTRANAISRVDLEFNRAGSAIVGQFRVGIEHAREEHAWPVRLIVAGIGILLTFPAALVISSGVLKQFFGAPALFDAVAAWNHTLVVGSLFVGAPLALIANLLAVTRVGFQRAEGKINTFLTLEASPVQLLIIAIALGVVALWWGHLLADELACLRGVHSAC